MTPERPSESLRDLARQFLYDLNFYVGGYLNELHFYKGTDSSPEGVVFLQKWQPTIDTWAEKSSTLREELRRMKDSKDSEQDWEVLIIRLGRIFEGASEFNAEASTLRSPNETDPWDMIRSIKRAAEKLDEIRRITDPGELKNTLAAYQCSSQ